MLIKEPYSELFPINNASSLDDRSSSCFRMPGLSDKSTPKSAMKSLPIPATVQRWIDFFAILGPWLSGLIMLVGDRRHSNICGLGVEEMLQQVAIKTVLVAIPGFMLGVLSTM
jgi:hypothetical protein